MRKAQEPTLFFSVYVHKHLPGFVPDDPRLLILEQTDAFADRYGLTAGGTVWRHERARDVDLVALDRSPSTYQPLVNLGHDDSRAIYQCLVYTHADALIVQIMIGRLHPWTGTLAEGWRELTDELHSGFDGGALERARQRTFGASLMYWAMADGETEPAEYAEEIPPIIGEGVRCTATDIGHLWQTEARAFPEARSVAQDLWLLVTPPTREAEAEANRRYNQPRLDGPPDFAVLALARHKFSFEWSQYSAEHGNLEKMRRSLDRRARWIIETQRYHGQDLADLRGHESIEFQDKLTRAANNLADYRQTVSLVEELRRTLYINRTNFLVNCPALISAEAAAAIAASPDKEPAASEVLAAWKTTHQEEVFGRELGRMQDLCDQIDADIDYTRTLTERHAASLAAGGEQLRIAGERELGEISAYHALEAAAVVASLAAIVTVELLRVGHTLEEEPVLAANLILLAVTGSFALVLMLSGRGRGKTWLHRASFATALGFVVGSGVAWLWGETTLSFAALNAAAVLGGALVGGIGHWAAELRALRRLRKRRRRKGDVMVTLDKLRYANEELADFLEDLPPVTAYRVKEEKSLLGKIDRINAIMAAEQGISVDELRERGEDYRVRDINDAIGVRYIVAPWRMAEVVDRVAAVTRPVEIDHKDVSGRLGYLVTICDGRRVEVEDPDYQGKYKGFKMQYKSVHIDVDLWGVGAHKDVNLMAEVQVRTPIQNLFANWFHDIMYKERIREPTAPGGRPGTRGWRAALAWPLRPWRHLAGSLRAANAASGTAPWLVRFFDHWHPWLNRPLARVLIWLSDVELWLFRGVMEWGEGEKAQPS